uniref:ATP-dependent Clp protease proteolytic subunit n=1 Tax=Treubaria triappendiculata TaxID=1755147 RepID=A0A0S2LMI9_TRETR|nr:proteolytic subunit 2 of clp protease [Treubaria triappendiculata]ALO62626.1 proteolytic subunit 2 of clp protease [Treubaria triappendiculata]
MPIGVPRIIYCWGEELPAQWTDIYNFIFRRRMVFLMQYLDDELCNQICGLLINIHMEDRAKELEKKEMENSGLFKSVSKSQKKPESGNARNDANYQSDNFDKNKKNANISQNKSIEDLLISEDDLAIDENNTLEQYTLQKITLEWLNWNSQFFDYSEEPYLFHMAELLSKDFSTDEKNLFYKKNLTNVELSKFLMLFKKMTNSVNNLDPKIFDFPSTTNKQLDIYSPFRFLSNFTSTNSNSVRLNLPTKKKFSNKLTQMVTGNSWQNQTRSISNLPPTDDLNLNLKPILNDLTQKEILHNINKKINSNFQKKVLTQKKLRKEYKQENILFQNSLKQRTKSQKPSSYLNPNSGDDSYLEYRDYYRKQTERNIQEEESKKVFVIINSFGGSVGNGITIHDALQFIKAGSLTLGLGVAASAASLALAGGTIGERYVTEGCHVMIHQPEGGLSGQASDIWIDSQEIMKIRLDVAEIYSLSTYRPRHKILRDLDRDFYLTAIETIFYGLADEIATNQVMHDIIEMTSKVWDYHESKQQRLLENRESIASGMDTQTQN